MAAIATKKIMPHRRLGLNTTPTIVGPQASAATFVEGDPVYFASGYITACAVVAIGSLGDCVDLSGDVLGIVQEPGTASSTGDVGVIPAMPNMLFKGQLITSLTTPALVDLAASHLGATACLTKLDTDSVYAVDVNASISAEHCVKIVELIDPVGTSGGEVGFVFLAAAMDINS